MLAQAVNDPGSWLNYLGPFIPFGGLAIYFLNYQRRKIDRLEDELREVTKEALPTLLRANERQHETNQMLEAMAVLLHSMTGRGPSERLLRRISEQLSRLEKGAR